MYTAFTVIVFHHVEDHGAQISEEETQEKGFPLFVSLGKSVSSSKRRSPLAETKRGAKMFPKNSRVR